jgi:hypothetical protein
MTAEMDPVEKRLMYIRYFLVTIKPIVFAIFIAGKRFTTLSSDVSCSETWTCFIVK